VNIFIDFLLGRSKFLNPSIIGDIIGAVGGYAGAKKAAQATETAARLQADASRFRPFNIRSGFGTGTFYDAPDGGYGEAVGMLNPGFQSIRDQYFGEAQGLSPELAGIRESLMRQANDPRLANLRDTYLDMAQSALGFDPAQASATYLDATRRLAAPEEERRRLDQENRLLAQGMLTSTGGAQRQQALESALSDADLKRIIASEQLGMDQQRAAIDQQRAAIDMANQLLGGADATTQSRLRDLQAALGLDDEKFKALGRVINLDQLALGLVDQGGILGGRATAGNAAAAAALGDATRARGLGEGMFYQQAGESLGRAADAALQNYMDNRNSNRLSDTNRGSYSPYDKSSADDQSFVERMQQVIFD
tara:strand:- start:923 stop:2017 length:1095 start_codon:yes stop_codon:yes gene_type:complete